MDSLEHILLTRFNLPSPGPESVVRAREGWLRERIALFERYCAPSVAAQRGARFHWLVYVDPQSPRWLLGRLDAASAHGLFRVVARDLVTKDDLLSDVLRLCGAMPSRLLTTNLDNDDGLAADFVARVQAAADGRGRAAVYLTRGLIRSPQGVYRRTDRHNAFCSVVDGGSSPDTAWLDWHTRLPHHMPTVEVAGAPAWLQVVHGSNVSNRVRGTLSSPAAHRGAFPPGLLDDVPEPGLRDLARDRVMSVPVRAGRDLSRSTLKQVALTVAGKDGLDRAKAQLARIRS